MLHRDKYGPDMDKTVGNYISIVRFLFFPYTQTDKANNV